MAAQGAYLVKISAVDGASKVFENLNKRMAAAQAPMNRLNKQIAKFTELSGINALGNELGKIINIARDVGGSLMRVVEPIGIIGSLASLAGVGLLTRQFAAWGQTLANTAGALSMNAARLSQWETAFELAGGKAEDAPKLFETLTLNLRKAFIEGDATLLTAFQAIGVTADDFYNNRVENVEQKTLAALRDPRKSAALKLTLRNIIQGGLSPYRFETEGTDKFLADAAKRSGATDRQITAAQKLDDSFRKLTASATGFSNAIIEQLSPVFAPLITQFADFLDENRQAIADQVGKWARDLAEWLKHIDWKNAKEDFIAFKEALAGIPATVEHLIAKFNDLDQPLVTIGNRSISIKQSFELLFDMMVARYVVGFITPLVRMTAAMVAFGEASVAALGASALGNLMPEAALAAFGLRLATFLRFFGAGAAVGVVGAIMNPTPLNQGEGALLDARQRYGARGDAALKSYRGYGGGLSIMPSIGLGAALGASEQQLQQDVGPTAPDRTTTGRPPSGRTVSFDDNTLQKMYADWKYFQSKGYTAEQSAGIVANFGLESGTSGYETATNSIGAYGKAQWLAARQALFQQWYGHPIQQSTSEEQDEFVYRELQSTEQAANAKLLATQGADAAGSAVSRFYERPENADSNAALRGELASKLLPDLQRMDAARAQQGQIDINVNHNGPPGSSVAVQPRGPMFGPNAPSIQQSVPAMGPN